MKTKSQRFKVTDFVLTYFDVIFSKSGSVDLLTKSMISSASAGGGYKISSVSNKNELTYALDTCTTALRFFNWLHNCITRRVPSKLILTVGRNVSLKSKVAAE